MKFFLIVLLVTFELNAFSQIPVPPAATQAEVNAGTTGNKYVSPKTLIGAGALTNNQTGVTLGGNFTGAIQDTISKLGIAPAIDFSQWVTSNVSIPYNSLAQFQGITTDGTNIYSMQGAYSIGIINKFNADGLLIVSNQTAIPNTNEWNTLEDGEYYPANNTLIVPMMFYIGVSANVVNLTAAIYDASTLAYLTNYPMSNSMPDCSSLTLDTADGVMYAIDEYDPNEIFKWTIPTTNVPCTFIGTLPLNPPIISPAEFLQGIAYKSNLIYMVSDNGNSGDLWGVDPLTGNDSWLTALNPLPGEYEGLDYFTTNFLCLVNPNIVNIPATPYIFSPPEPFRLDGFGISHLSDAHLNRLKIDGIVNSEQGYETINDGEILYLPFSDSTNQNIVYDRSKNGVQLRGVTVLNTIKAIPNLIQSPWGFALDFNGNTALRDYTATDFQGMTSFTISFEFCTTNINLEYFITRHHNSTDGEFFVSKVSTNEIQFTTINTNLNRVSLIATNSQALNDDKWHNCTVTYDGSLIPGTTNQYIYIDGNEIGATTNTGPLASTIHCLRLGCFDGSVAPPYYIGQMDEVRIWNRALTPDEVLSYYEKEYPHGLITGNGSGLTNLTATNIVGTVPLGNLDPSVVTNNYAGLFNIIAPAVSSREYYFMAYPSDATGSFLFGGNGSSVIGRATPTDGGYAANSLDDALFLDGLISSANDSGTVPVMLFTVRRTSSATDPLNGTTTAITTRPLFVWNNDISPVMSITANGVLNVNGSGITNMDSTYFTNFISGSFYTNSTGKAMSIKVPITLTTASVSGNCEVDLKLAPTNTAALILGKRCGGATVIGSLAESEYGELSETIPNGWYFTITNNVSGIGNSASIDSSATNTVVLQP